MQIANCNDREWQARACDGVSEIVNSADTLTAFGVADALAALARFSQHLLGECVCVWVKAHAPNKSIRWFRYQQQQPKQTPEKSFFFLFLYKMEMVVWWLSSELITLLTVRRTNRFRSNKQLKFAIHIQRILILIDSGVEKSKRKFYENS